VLAEERDAAHQLTVAMLALLSINFGIAPWK
jgi:hypothetical protein